MPNMSKHKIEDKIYYGISLTMKCIETCDYRLNVPKHKLKSRLRHKLEYEV